MIQNGYFDSKLVETSNFSHSDPGHTTLVDAHQHQTSTRHFTQLNHILMAEGLEHHFDYLQNLSEWKLDFFERKLLLLAEVLLPQLSNFDKENMSQILRLE